MARTQAISSVSNGLNPEIKMLAAVKRQKDANNKQQHKEQKERGNQQQHLKSQQH